MVEPEVVATSPNRIKSPVPVCCGFSSRKMVLAAGFAPALATFSTSCLFCWTTRAKTMEPPAGAAPARFSYKENLQAAAERQKKWWAATILPNVLRSEDRGIMKPGNSRNFPWWRTPSRGRLSSGSLECRFIYLLLNLAMLVLFAKKQTPWFIY